MRLSRRAKRRWLVLVGGAMVIAVSVTAIKTVRGIQQQRAIATSLEEGLAAYEAGDYARVLDTLRVFISYRKNDPEVIAPLLKFANARRQVPKEDGTHMLESRDLFQHARKLLAGHRDVADHDALLAETQEQLIELYGILGMRAELLDATDQVLARDGDDVTALGARGRVLYLNRDFAGAERCARRLIELQPAEVSWRQMLLQVLAAADRAPQELLEVCRGWSEQWEGDGRMLLIEAGWLASMGRDRDARRAIDAAASRGASTLEVLQNMVSLLDLLGLRERATALLEEARSSFPAEQWVREAMVRRHWQVGHVDEALAEVQRTFEEFEQPERGMLRLHAMLLVAAGRTDDARNALQRLEEQAGAAEDGSADIAWVRALRLALERENASWRELVSACQHALSLRADDAMLHFMLGELYIEVAAFSPAIAAFGRAVAIEPSWIAAGTSLADAQLRAGRSAEALRSIQSVLGRSDRARVGAYILLARCYLGCLRDGGAPVLNDGATGRPISIAAMLERIVAEFPDRTDALPLLVEAYALTGRDGEANRLVFAPLRDGSEDPDLLVRLAEISAAYGLGAERDLLARARDVAGLDLGVALAEAQRLARAGRPEAGLVVLDEAIAAAEPAVRAAAPTRLRRAAYLVEMEHPDALSELARLSEQFADAEAVQVFILSLTESWQREDLVRSAIDRLAEIVGPQFDNVKLAEANYALRFHPGDETRRAQAIVDIAGVLEHAPDSLAALTLMADASLRGDRPHVPRAIEHLRRAVEVAPGRRDLLVKLVALLQREGDFDAAEQYLKQLGRLAPYDRRAREGQLRLLAQQPGIVALDDLVEISDTAATEAEQLILASLQERAGAVDRAEAIYRRLLAADGASPFAARQAADFFARTGRFEEAVDLLQDHAEGLAEADGALLLGAFYDRHGHGDEAREWLGRAVAADPNRAVARVALARHHLARGAYREARDEALSGLALAPDDPGLRSILAAVNLELDESSREEAIELLRELAVQDDGLLATLTLLDAVPREDGKPRPRPEDLAAARELIETHGGFLPAWMLAITLHADAGDTRTAIELARKAVGRFPTTPGPAEWATRVLMQNGAWDEALVEAQEWRRRVGEDSYDVDVVSAALLVEAGRSADAVARLQAHEARILREATSSPRPLLTWMRALCDTGRAAAAWTALGPLAEADAKWVRAWLELAAVADADIARSMISRAQGLAKGRPALALSVARAWSDHGWRAGDVESFAKAEAILDGITDADEADVHLLRGRIAEGRGAMDAAVAHYRQALAQRPDDVTALNNLAYVLARTAGGGAEAVALAQRALRVRPGHPDLLDTLAIAQLAAGDAGAAQKSLERALRARPEDVGLHLSLAEVLTTTGDGEAARRSLDTAERLLREQGTARAHLRERMEELRRSLDQAQASIP